MIYADYQATTPVDPRVVERMGPYWNESFGNPHSNEHAAGWQAAAAVQAAQASLANLIGADPDEVIFTSGATEANNLAILGLARRADPKRRRILVSAIEHKCVLAAAHHLEEQEGFTVEHIPVDSEGFLDLDHLQDRIDDDVMLVSVMAVNNEVGTIQDLSAIGAYLADRGIHFHTDAAQAPCAMDMTGLVRTADLVSLSGHKMYGPQGIGALYIRRDLQSQIEPLIHGGGQQNGLRSGTLPLALCVGLGAAAEIMASEQVHEERKRVAGRRDMLLEGLEAAGIETRLNGPAGEWRHPGNANLQFPGQVAEDLIAALQPTVAASTGAACSSGIPEPSHVLRAMGLGVEESASSVRFSFGRFTTEDDVRLAEHEIIRSIGDWSA